MPEQSLCLLWFPGKSSGVYPPPPERVVNGDFNGSRKFQSRRTLHETTPMKLDHGFFVTVRL
ncbi:hypothetical protein YC2023_073089 [Brassica napus]